MSDQSLSDFIARIKGNGILTSQHFYVELPVLAMGDQSNVKAMAPPRMNMMCESVNLPGFKIATMDQRIYGEITEYPYMPTYAPLQLTFLVDREQDIIDYFSTWQQMIIDPVYRSSGYYNDYAKTLEIHVKDFGGKIARAVKIYGAYPIDISDIPLSYSNHEMIRLSVSLNYKYWRYMEVQADGKATRDKEEDIQPYPWIPTEELEYSQELLRAEQLGEVGQTLTTNIGVNGLDFDQYTDFAQKQNAYAKIHGPEVLRQSNATYAAFASAVGGNVNTQQFGTGILKMGTITNDMSNKIANMANSDYSNTSRSQLSSSVGYLQNVLQDLNGTAGQLGIGSPFGNTTSALASIGASINSGASLAVIQAQLKNLGNSVKNIGGGFGSISQMVMNMPGGSNIILNSVNKLSGSLSNNGESLSSIAGSIL